MESVKNVTRVVYANTERGILNKLMSITVFDFNFNLVLGSLKKRLGL